MKLLLKKYRIETLEQPSLKLVTLKIFLWLTVYLKIIYRLINVMNDFQRGLSIFLIYNTYRYVYNN